MGAPRFHHLPEGGTRILPIFRGGGGAVGGAPRFCLILIIKKTQKYFKQGHGTHVGVILKIICRGHPDSGNPMRVCPDFTAKSKSLHSPVMFSEWSLRCSIITIGSYPSIEWINKIARNSLQKNHTILYKILSYHFHMLFYFTDIMRWFIYIFMYMCLYTIITIIIWVISLYSFIKHYAVVILC